MGYDRFEKEYAITAPGAGAISEVTVEVGRFFRRSSDTRPTAKLHVRIQGTYSEGKKSVQWLIRHQTDDGSMPVAPEVDWRMLYRNDSDEQWMKVPYNYRGERRQLRDRAMIGASAYVRTLLEKLALDPEVTRLRVLCGATRIDELRMQATVALFDAATIRDQLGQTGRAQGIELPRVYRQSATITVRDELDEEESIRRESD